MGLAGTYVGRVDLNVGRVDINVGRIDWASWHICGASSLGRVGFGANRLAPLAWDLAAIFLERSKGPDAGFKSINPGSLWD